ncbi:MAG: hypothetical protein R3B69_01695 [Candidatus Paceibacterota bacterium]
MPKSPENKKKRIEKLRTLVAYHQRKYHEEDTPEISDEAYDSLVRELQELEGATDESVNSITTAVGGTASDAFSKVKHRVRQWSLSNVFTLAELEDWEARLRRHLAAEDVTDYQLEHART